MARVPLPPRSCFVLLIPPPNEFLDVCHENTLGRTTGLEPKPQFSALSIIIPMLGFLDELNAVSDLGSQTRREFSFLPGMKWTGEGVGGGQ